MSWRHHWLADPVILLLVALGVLLGSYQGESSQEEDIDERLYRSTLVHMQDGDSYYDATAKAVVEKSGVGPSQVRSLRTPVLATLLEPFPPDAWRWLAMVPAVALCLASAALAGPDLLARRTAAGIAALWMVVSLPLLYLHQELWGAALLALGGWQLRTGRDGRAAVLCLLATAVRELFGISLLVGLLLRRDRRPWVAALVAAGLGAALHARWAQDVLDDAGFDPPLRATESYLSYLSPGTGGVAQALGLALLVAAAVGFWRRRHLDDQRFLVAATAPLVVATALTGRVYWSLTWCAVTSAAGAVTVSAAVEALRERFPRPTAARQ